MSEHQPPSRFCIICYKTTSVSVQGDKSLENISKFVKIVNRLIKRQETDILCKLFVTEKLLECCNKCKGFIEGICEIYNQLKILELKLGFKLDKLVEKINYANKVPTRWIHVNRVLEEIFLNDTFGKAEGQKKIRKFRQSVIEAGNQSKLQTQPRVLLCGTDDVPQLGKRSISPAGTESLTQDETENEETENIHEGQSERKFKCRWCPKTFTHSTNLSSHVRSHTGERPFKCRFCKVEFRYRSNFTRHLKSVHANQKGIEEELKKRWTQKTDDRQYNSVNKLVNSEESIDYQKKICPKCGKKLTTIEGLKIHLEHHKDQSEWKWPCHQCSKRFTTRENLNVHLRSHTGERPYKCRFCGMAYRHRHSFTKHLKVNHPGEKEFEKELKRRWFNKSVDVTSNLVNIENHEDETEYDDMPDLDDYSEDIYNDEEIDPDENLLPEIEEQLEGNVNISNDDDDMVTGPMITKDETAKFQDPQIQIKIEHPAIFKGPPEKSKLIGTLNVPNYPSGIKEM